MEKKKRTIDDIFEMSDSRYSLVNAISKKAREIADEAESNNDVLYRKPVNMVIDRLLDGRATIEHIEPEEEVFHPHDFPVKSINYTIDSDDEEQSPADGEEE
ncbi:MAG: DNA-directed RNA polymerase subunit omega [Clostridia bacterium]|jgi:DNA-directed RNA polymerase subunit K/omega|nr:DNA-directed RNA polymerase subunit omega [Clostridia bacterium]